MPIFPGTLEIQWKPNLLIVSDLPLLWLWVDTTEGARLTHDISNHSICMSKNSTQNDGPC